MSGQAWRDRPPISSQFPRIRAFWRAIAAEGRYAIQHDMVPGEPFPSLTALEKMYQVHRSTARKAVYALAAEGLIELVPGRGYRVPLAPKAG